MNSPEKSVFAYTYLGTRYRSDVLEFAPTKQSRTSSATQSKATSLPNTTIAPYSERAGIGYGETKVVKEEVEKLGCGFKPWLRVY